MARGPSAQAVQHRARGYRGGRPPQGRPRECERRSSRCVASLQMSEPITYPGARRPDRQRTVDSHGLAIAVHEWGDDDAPPILLAHGGFDFAGTFDVFAPLLADGRVAGRGVGPPRPRRLASTPPSTAGRPTSATRSPCSTRSTPDAVPVVGHSKGGSLMLQLADALPHRVSHLVNLDGLPVAAQLARRRPTTSARSCMANELTSWLDHRRPPRRRAAQAGHHRRAGGAAPPHEPAPRPEPGCATSSPSAPGEDADGWRWKIDPTHALRRLRAVAARSGR